MIVTHTINASGQRRVYLGSKCSLECWIEPASAHGAWSFHLDIAPTCYPLQADKLRATAAHLLLALAEELKVAPAELKSVPFETIAALHVVDPADYRRVAAPRRSTPEHAFVSTPPHVTRPERACPDESESFQRRH